MDFCHLWGVHQQQRDIASIFICSQHRLKPDQHGSRYLQLAGTSALRVLQLMMNVLGGLRMTLQQCRFLIVTDSDLTEK